jgi:hypothetical protein
VPPVLTLVTAALLTVLPVDGLVDWQNVVWVVADPLVLLALSGLVCGYYRLHKWLQRHPQQESRDRGRGWWQRRWRGWLRQWLEKDRDLWREPPEREDRDRAMDTWVAGDVLAVSVVAMAGLGLIRSLTAPVLLGPLGGAMGTWIVRGVALLAGAALAGVTFPLAKALLGQLDRNRQRSRVKRRLRPDDNWRPDRPRPG